MKSVLLFFCPVCVDTMYSVSHKVEISERFESHRLELKGQSTNSKHAEKIDELKLNGENVDIQMSTLMLNCTFLAFFERSLISTLWDRLYLQQAHTLNQGESNLALFSLH